MIVETDATARRHDERKKERPDNPIEPVDGERPRPADREPAHAPAHDVLRGEQQRESGGAERGEGDGAGNDPAAIRSGHGANLGRDSGSRKHRIVAFAGARVARGAPVPDFGAFTPETTPFALISLSRPVGPPTFAPSISPRGRF